MTGGPLTLETYHRFFVDPWNTRIKIGQLNQILYMHGFTKLHHGKKAEIMERMVGQVDLLPPRRSTLHGAALPVASPPSAAVITAAQARDDVEAIGWAECPIGCVAAFAAPRADAPEPVERLPRRADFVLAGRRPRSKRTRGSAFGPGPSDVAAAAAASMKLKAGAPQKKAKVIVKDEEKETEFVSVSPSPAQPPPPPPLCTRSPTPPPPASPPPQQDVAPPPPPPPCQPQPTLAPIPAPPAWATHMVPRHPSQQLFWGLPLPSRATALPCPAMPPPGWSRPAPPPSYPAPFWGVPVMLPPLAPHLGQHSLMQLQRLPPPLLLHFLGQPLPALIQRPPPPPLPHFLGQPLPALIQRPPPHFLGQPLPALIQRPPPPPLLLQQPPLLPTPPPPTLHCPPLHFDGQHPPPALLQTDTTVSTSLAAAGLRSVAMLEGLDT